jgi:hypothetical protein
MLERDAAPRRLGRVRQVARSASVGGRRADACGRVDARDGADGQRNADAAAKCAEGDDERITPSRFASLGGEGLDRGGRSNQSSSWANRGPLTALHIDIGPDVARGRARAATRGW